MSFISRKSCQIYENAIKNPKCMPTFTFSKAIQLSLCWLGCLTPLCYVPDDQFNPKYSLTPFIFCPSDIHWLIQAANLTAYFNFFNKTNHSLVSYDMILLAFISVACFLLGLQCILSNSAAISSGVLFLISGTLNLR